MIRWVVVIFLFLTIFNALLPWIFIKIGVGRIPGDIRLKLDRRTLILPLGSTVLWSAVAFLIAELVKRVL
ncbi:hypothetical protein GCM10007205_22930 [Oxalicibacterium flavum]|uniref:DUF2905 domain-containing protein n=1 Tax=Oxalicibacterium flavum TaxID=179467 RepID=A0A8J2UNC0_9BURK|nr:DUF2905 domain-containing protein [Oxalicibacterium flavum]GGC13422.1 hypothetical protein GCM10007205_22930 [Oxalicibacterium flavum]